MALVVVLVVLALLYHWLGGPVVPAVRKVGRVEIVLTTSRVLECHRNPTAGWDRWAS